MRTSYLDALLSSLNLPNQGRVGVRADPDHGGDLQPGHAALLRRGRRPPEGQLLGTGEGSSRIYQDLM